MTTEIRNKTISLILCVIMALGFFAFPGYASADSGGSFSLYAATSAETLIGPTRIAYTSGQTIMEALQASEYSFETHGIYTDVIEGVEGSYMFIYDGGGYDLEQPANTISTLLITENQNQREEHLELLKSMMVFRERTDNVQNYPDASEAYEQGLRLLRTGSYDEASACRTSLDGAMADYDAIMNGTKYTVSISAKQNGSTLSAPSVTLTDEYGNVTNATGNSLQVVAGKYTVSVSDGGWNRVELTKEVKGRTPISAELPYGEWFGDIDLKDQSTRQAYDKSQDASTHTLIVNVPDTGGSLNPVINVAQGSVPDTDKTKLYGVYVGLDGKDYSNNSRSWASNSATLASLLGQGMEGRSFALEARYEMSGGITQIQSYNVEIRRYPTLKSLSVSDGDTMLPLLDGDNDIVDFDPLKGEYIVRTTADSLNIQAEAFDADYIVNGTGEFDVTDGAKKVITVKTSDKTNSYTINIQKVSSVSVSLSVPSGTTAAVYNIADSEVKPTGGAYKLVPGDEYFYVATKNTHYHTRSDFIAQEGVTISVAEPETADHLNDFAIYNSNSSTSRKRYEPDSPFASSDHSLVYTVPDAASSLYSQADPDTDFTVTAEYNKQTQKEKTNGTPSSVKITNQVGETSGTSLNNCVASGGFSQKVTLRVSKKDGDVTSYQDYDILIRRSLHMRSLAVSDGYSNLSFLDSEGKSISFDRDITEYTVSVDRSTGAILINGEFINEKTDSASCGGYWALVNGERYDKIADVSVPLDPEQDTETLTVEVCHEDADSVNTVYNVTVKKVVPVTVTFVTDPADAAVFVIDNVTGKRVEGNDKAFSVIPGRTYTYTVTSAGYVGYQVTDYIAPETDGNVEVTLSKASKNGTLPDYEAYWGSTRYDEYNNSCIDAATPSSAENATLYWATKVGEGYSSGACGCPIIVDGYIYTYAGNKIYKIDTISGEILKSGTMDHASSFAINTPTYAEGMIFVGLSDGTIQAFNADTLESVWIYHDSLKGQPDCPIAYHDGHIYTGFWNGESAKANYVCLSVTDEDPAKAKEEKLASWTYTSQGGFYWSGAYVTDDYMLVATDDGKVGYTTGYAKVLSIDPKSGNLIDSYKMSNPGDLRSGVTFVPDGSGGGTGYFTSKGGDFYKLGVEADGKFTSNSLKHLKLPNFSTDANNPGMSTSTPSVYNGRAYVGVAGTSQFGQYSGHNITVIDLNSWSIAYSVRTQGYPQTSGLISTAYEAETGTVNVYFFDNYTPGKMRMITDKPGQTKASPITVEKYTAGGTTTSYDTGYVLFTPYGDQSQYCICSPIADEYGTLYYKNDSAYMMAVGSTISSLEITKDPDKTTYSVGEVFDPAGMKVEAVYANGARRDVTAYVEWSEKPLTAKDDHFQIYFPYVMYHDEEGAPGTKVQEPFANLKITVEDHVWSEPTYTWAEDNLSVTAKAICSDCGKELTETVNAVYSVIKQPTDTEDGEGVYQSEAFKNEIFKVQTKTVVIPAGDHIYGEPTWSWAEDWSSAEAVFTGEDGTEIPVSAQIDIETVDPTCTEDGKTVYTATATYEGKDFTDIKEKPIPALGHDWGEWKVTKATLKANGSKKRTCSLCGETEKTIIYYPKTFKLSKTSYVYDGKTKKPTIKITDVKGKTVTSENYTVSYAKGRKNVGKYKVTVNMKGNYEGKKTLTFKINPKSTSLKSPTAAKKALTVKWNKQSSKMASSRITGYEIWLATDKAFSKNLKKVTVKGYSKTSKKVTKLKAKTKYYVKIRTYMTVNRTNYYSKWSAVKTKKTK